MPELFLRPTAVRTADDGSRRSNDGHCRVFESWTFPAIDVWISVFGLLLILLPLSACVSHDEARKQAQAAYQAGFREGQESAEAKLTQVFFEGPVQQQHIVWHPNLTLAQAIVEAVYTARNDPKSIVVTRHGTPQLVDPRSLLQGVDFLLEPGDVIHLIP